MTWPRLPKVTSFGKLVVESNVTSPFKVVVDRPLPIAIVVESSDKGFPVKPNVVPSIVSGQSALIVKVLGVSSRDAVCSEFTRFRYVLFNVAEFPDPSWMLTFVPEIVVKSGPDSQMTLFGANSVMRLPFSSSMVATPSEVVAELPTFKVSCREPGPPPL